MRTSEEEIIEAGGFSVARRHRSGKGSSALQQIAPLARAQRQNGEAAAAAAAADLVHPRLFSAGSAIPTARSTASGARHTNGHGPRSNAGTGADHDRS